MKRVCTRVAVWTEGDRPRLINLPDRTLVVKRVEDRWTAAGTDHGEVRLYFRVETQVGMLHLYRSGAHWFLPRMVH